jgi:hypothetical protein
LDNCNPFLNRVSCAVCDPCLVAHVSTVTVVELSVQCGLGYCLDSRVKFIDAFFHGGVVRYFCWFNTYVGLLQFM